MVLFYLWLSSMVVAAPPWEIDRLQNIFQDPTIFGGRPNDASSPVARFTVGVGTETNIRCTGTLIAQNVVLTAGHCVKSPAERLIGPGPNKKDLRVHFFVNQKSSTGKTQRKHYKSQIAQVITHPIWSEFVRQKLEGSSFFPLLPKSNGSGAFENWNSYRREAAVYAYDLAVLILPVGAPFGTQIAKLPRTNEFPRWNPSCQYFVTGFGEDSTTTEKERKNFLSKFGVVGISNLKTTEIGIQVKGTPSVCHGDSGGPLLEVCGEEAYVIGIASHLNPTAGGLNCEDPAASSVHSYVSRSLDWILEQLKKNESLEHI